MLTSPLLFVLPFCFVVFYSLVSPCNLFDLFVRTWAYQATFDGMQQAVGIFPPSTSKKKKFHGPGFHSDLEPPVQVGGTGIFIRVKTKE
jgi:hypothetical protein